MTKPRKPRASRVATALNPEVLPPEPSVPMSPEDGQREFEAALRNLVEKYEQARAVRTLFSPVMHQLMQAVKFQVEFLTIGSLRRARAGAQDAEQVAS